MSKYILVTGATGKQGGAVIQALSNNRNITILAVTRDSLSATAKELRRKHRNVELVEVNLNDASSIFVRAQTVAQGSPLWGVFSVQVSQGPNVTTDGEIAQGKSVVDESVKAGVQHFVYSSVERGGNDESWECETSVPHFQTKHHIEHYLRSNAGSMSWTILRPVAFMDNLIPSFGTRVFLAALRDSLNPVRRPLQWVACADIGVFASLAFQHSRESTFKNRAIGLAGSELTVDELSAAFQRQTKSPLVGTYQCFGTILRFFIPEIRLMIDWFATSGYKADIGECRKIHPGMMDIETWIITESRFEKNV